MRVVIVILDSFPASRVSAEETPNLLHYAKTISTGRSLPVSVTYANHAAFFTGAGPAQTGLWGNAGWTDENKFKTTPAIGPVAPSLFDSCNAAGLRSIAIMGWPTMLSSTGADQATIPWPLSPGPELKRDSTGYLHDDEVMAQIERTDLSADLVAIHFNNPDSCFHAFGPESPQARLQIAQSDALFARVMQQLQDQWQDTVVLGWSDHCQEPVDGAKNIDLKGYLSGLGFDLEVHHDGTAAIVAGEFDRQSLLTLEGVQGFEEPKQGITLVWCKPLYHFHTEPSGIQGDHGGPRCRDQLTLVAGGHPAAEALAQWLEGSCPDVTEWASKIAALLNLEHAKV